MNEVLPVEEDVMLCFKSCFPQKLAGCNVGEAQGAHTPYWD